MVTNGEEILDFQQLVRMTPMAESVARYAVDLVRATRPETDRECAGLRQEVCELRRKRARRAISGAGRQGPGADARPFSCCPTKTSVRWRSQSCGIACC